MEKENKFDLLDLLGKELFRKNNNTFYRSNLSNIMKRMFIAANKDCGITEVLNEQYMKSGILTNKVYYIYTDQLDRHKDKFYDIVYFNGEKCVWFYLDNTIDAMVNPVQIVQKIYYILLNTFEDLIHYSSTFFNKELMVVHKALVIRLLSFLETEYGILKLKDEMESLYKELKEYTKDSIDKFIDHIIENSLNDDYFTKKLYLESYMLLEYKPRTDTTLD